MEDLSIDYFAALSACPHEEIEQLLLLPELDERNSSNVSTDQALQYLNAIVTLSPAFQESNTVPAASAASSLAEKISEAQTTKQSSKLFTNIRNAVSILAPSARHEISFSGILPKLNSISNNPHAQVEFLQCCILASQYRYARKTFDSLFGLGHVPGDSSNSKNTELYLRYHYLRGIIYYNCDEITSAVTEWNICISAPSHAMSHIILKAWKKMVLAKCFMTQFDDEEEMKMAKKDLKDHILSFPTGTSTAISKFLNGGTSKGKDVEEYKKLVGKFVQNELDSFLKVSTSTNGADTKLINLLQEDEHMGMVKRLVPVMLWRKFRNVSKIYTSIPWEKLAKVLGVGQNECVEFLMEAAMKQSLDGSCLEFRAPVEFTLDDEEGIVYFDVKEKEQDLEGRIENCMKLAQRVQDLDVALVSSSKYQMKLQKNCSEEKRATEPSRSVVELS
jgi:hypothetical protein